MKQFVFVCIALVVLGVAWTLYLEHEKERFVESLPKVPPVVTQPVDVGDMPLDTDTDTDGVVNTTEAQSPLSKDAPMETVDAAETTVLPESEHLAPTEVVVDAVETTSPDVPMVSADKMEPTFIHSPFPHLHDSSVSTDWAGLSRAAKIERHRENLIKQFGNRPEVHILVQTIDNGPKYQYSSEENLKIAEAIFALFPNDANRSAVEIAKQHQLRAQLESPRRPGH